MNWPVIELIQNMDQFVGVQLKNEDGTPVLLDVSQTANAGVDTQEDDSSVPEGTQPVTVEDSSTVVRSRLWMREHLADSSQVIEVPAFYDGAGAVSIGFTAPSTSRPGLFIGDIQLLDVHDNLLFLRRCYIEIEQNSTDGNFYNYPPTIAEIRLALRDYPEANYLLDDYEFSAREIASCIRKPVDYWNESNPPVGLHNYSNFPYRFNWMNGIIAQLMLLASHAYRRNKLPYTAAGMSVDDQSKSPEYQQTYQQMWQEYTTWVRERKIMLNVMGGFANVPGEWSF
jgi:hypothetical protein